MNHPNRYTLAQQRRGKDGSKASPLLVGFGLRELGFEFCRNIMNMDCFSVDHRTATDRTSAHWESPLARDRR